MVAGQACDRLPSGQDVPAVLRVHTGRQFVLALDHEEDLLDSLTQFCADQGIRAGYIPTFVGGLRSARLVGSCEPLADAKDRRCYSQFFRIVTYGRVVVIALVSSVLGTLSGGEAWAVGLAGRRLVPQLLRCQDEVNQVVVVLRKHLPALPRAADGPRRLAVLGSSVPTDCMGSRAHLILLAGTSHHLSVGARCEAHDRPPNERGGRLRTAVHPRERRAPVSALGLRVPFRRQRCHPPSLLSPEYRSETQGPSAAVSRLPWRGRRCGSRSLSTALLSIPPQRCFSRGLVMCQHKPICPLPKPRTGRPPSWSRPTRIRDGRSCATVSCSSRLCRSLRSAVSLSCWVATRTGLCRTTGSSPTNQRMLAVIVFATWVGER
ncbi:DUF296 domain-containing protein (plasmid) [Streptomyces sp. AM 4-1-1]|uniref:PCC domain-containing protein n=1 Tax=Streptomyces sp. AM 4-1-1 TaxID=3028710 RepID=UPI0023BA0B5D|nr:DUF296 domain-containing protein [Streptomyces sp. AM 4-1-1]WEH37852.1 DUF296 domain-containing protein [Streptomyces sp. AM 4-1-1]